MLNDDYRASKKNERKEESMYLLNSYIVLHDSGSLSVKNCVCCIKLLGEKTFYHSLVSISPLPFR